MGLSLLLPPLDSGLPRRVRGILWSVLASQGGSEAFQGGSEVSQGGSGVAQEGFGVLGRDQQD